MAGAFGQALLDHYRGEREEPLRQRDGEETRVHPIEDFYFDSFADAMGSDWVAGWVDGPLVDLGAGAGRDALHFQTQFETVAVEVSEQLVTLLTERGVERVQQADMFALTDAFEPDRFQSALALGTQLGLAKSMTGLRAFLDDLATVTTADATAVLDCYDPTYGDADEMLGFRSDPTPGLAYRVVQYEYGTAVDETLLFRLFSPERLRAATDETPWTVAEVERPRDAYYYRAAMRKRGVS